jgi:hypothetical protein
VKDQGGHSIAVYKPRAKKGGKGVAETLIEQGRVNFAVPANDEDGTEADQTIKAIIDKIAADAALKRLGKRE